MDLVEIPLSNGDIAIIDRVDVDLIDFNWFPLAERRTTYVGRKQAKGHQPQQRRMHREIMERVLGRELKSHEQVDHIDGNGLNNRRENLRLASNTENVRNQRLSRANKSGYKGVFWSKKLQKWQAAITADGKNLHLGFFDDPAVAHEFYRAAALAWHGDFANFGDGTP